MRLARQCEQYVLSPWHSLAAVLMQDLPWEPLCLVGSGRPLWRRYEPFDRWIELASLEPVGEQTLGLYLYL